MNERRKRINPEFEIEDYNLIVQIAKAQHTSASALVRNWALEGLNGTLNSQNIDFLAPIIREQLKSILEPSIDRLASLSAKTCIQAGAAAYLSADAIYKFVPPAQREDVEITYEAARKKALQYMKSKVDMK